MEMICNGEFMSKAPDEACDYFDLLAKNAQVWETTESSDKANYGPSYKGGLYYLKEEDVLNSRLANLIRKVEVIELSKIGVTKTSAPIENSCGICETNTHFMMTLMRPMHTKDNLVYDPLRLIILIGEITPTLVGGMVHLSMNPKDLLLMSLMCHQIRRP